MGEAGRLKRCLRSAGRPAKADRYPELTDPRFAIADLRCEDGLVRAVRLPPAADQSCRTAGLAATEASWMDSSPTCSSLPPTLKPSDRAVNALPGELAELKVACPGKKPSRQLVCPVADRYKGASCPSWWSGHLQENVSATRMTPSPTGGDEWQLASAIRGRNIY